MFNLTRDPYPCAEKSVASSCITPTPRQLLEEKKSYLTKQLAETEEALAFFDANPSFEQGLTVLQKALR